MDDSAITAAFVAMAMGMFKLVEKLINKANGGGAAEQISFRLGKLEEEVSETKQKLHGFMVAFYEFREETRIRWAKLGDDKDE